MGVYLVRAACSVLWGTRTAAVLFGSRYLALAALVQNSSAEVTRRVPSSPLPECFKYGSPSSWTEYVLIVSYHLLQQQLAVEVGTAVGAVRTSLGVQHLLYYTKLLKVETWCCKKGKLKIPRKYKSRLQVLRARIKGPD